MAKLRVFLSSTYYDFRHVRIDLERFIRDQGYDPILNEQGHIPYGSEGELELYCYKEIEHCDILVSIIGGRYGSTSKELPYSISNLELKTAIKSGKQVYIFIEENVHIEYRTYLANKEKTDINYSAVDNINIYKFIEEIYTLTSNNQIKSFDSIPKITSYLKEQWSGLFQKLLSEKEKQKEINLIDSLTDTVQTLNKLVDKFSEPKIKENSEIKDIVFSRHPLFQSLKNVLKVPFRIIFFDRKELEDLLRYYKYRRILNADYPNYYSYTNNSSDVIHISKSLFKDEKLTLNNPSSWSDDLLIFIENDEIPF